MNADEFYHQYRQAFKKFYTFVLDLGFKALMDTLSKFRSKVRIFTPRTSLNALIKQYSGDEDYSYPCRGGINFFFVDAKSGDAYPCGYRGGESFKKFWDLNINKIEKTAFCKRCDWECFRDPS